MSGGGTLARPRVPEYDGRASGWLAVVVVLLLLVACNEPTTRVAPAVPELTTAWAPAPRARTSGCASQAGLPDPACTPGALDARVTQADLRSTICSRGYTASVRPPANATEQIKRRQMAAYGLTGQRLGDYELDHLVPLELGGAPADEANLWPMPLAGDGNAHMKDAVESFLNREVCRGAMQLAEAQRQIATDWLAVYRNHRLTPAP